MATLTISFNTVAGGTDYAVCYRPVGGVYTCVTVQSSPVIVSTGIECGTEYEVSVTSICAATGLQGTPQTATSNAIDCATCYTVHIYAEQAPNNYIYYKPVGSSSYVAVPVNSLPFSGGFYDQSFCSTQAVLLVNGSFVPQSLVNGSTITTAGTPCNNDLECRSEGPVQYYAQTLSGVGATACTNQTVTLWSDCTFSEFGVGCSLFTDSSGTPLTGETAAWVNGFLWDIDPVTGAVLAESTTQCAE